MLAWLPSLLLVAITQSPPALAADGGCSKTSVGKLAKVEQPAVLVLGERKGTLPDLSRAARLVKKLLKKGSVTVALQAVRAKSQDALDQYARGGLSMEVLPERLDWQNSWGFPFEAYERVLGTGRQGAKLVAIGGRYLPRPQDASGGAPSRQASLPIPPGYVQMLEDPMGDNPIPVELESRFAEFVAYSDRRFADIALAAWDGTGVLVILVDRYHVEGGMGVQWQAQTMTEAPVKGVLLADAESRCYKGDLVLP
jgi:hypothetical protein